jgi:hypothetical protein
VTPSSVTAIVAPTSAVPVKVGVTSFVDTGLTTGAVGAVASTVTDVEVDVLPAASVAVTVTEAPSLCVVVKVIV